jgi:DNA topoisomerase-1
VVERERERMAFVSASYFDIKGLFETGLGSEPKFEAKLFTYNGQRIATGDSFNDKGELTAQVLLLDEDKANALADAIKASSSNVEVISVEAKPSTRRPAAPFTTSTLQQEASRKLRMSAKQTMDVAQSLYQQGYITYMRTDSPTLSTQAINAARSQAKEMFGEEYVASAPRIYQGKNKNAQEAHEAIRPAGEIFKKPSELAGELLGRTFDLYDLIWKRTVASQMQDAKVSTTTAKIAVFPLPNGDRAEFTASGTVVTFRGFMAAYEESQDEPRNEDEENEEKESKLPNMEVGQKLNVLEINAKSHQTSPPPRYTEASLVKALEEDGIGRPSTYAAIISNIINKGYVTKRGQALVPEWIAFTVMRFLEDKVSRLVDYEFTARMEEDLDEIANGKINRSEWLKEFYFGSQGNPGLTSVVENIGEIDAKALNSLDLGDGITLRTGKFGPYLEIYIEPNAEGADENGRRIINIPEGLAPDELTLAKAHELIEAPIITDRILGQDPVSGHNVLFKDGRYGPYVLLDDPDAKKPKTASLFKTMTAESMNLETALKLLSLPRVVGQDAEGVDITTQNGKFGPYLLRAKDSRSLASEDLIFDLTLEGALELLAQPKLRGRVTAATPLKEFGEDPSAKTKVVAKSGQFGLYVTDGAINATVPKDEPLEELTSERAFELLAIRREKLGLEPGQAAPKASKSRKAAAPARTVKKGATRKKDS